MKTSFTKTRIISLSAAAVLLAFAVIFTIVLPKKNLKPELESGSSATLVKVIYPEISTIESTFSTTGKLKALKRFQLVSQVDGQLETSAQLFRNGKTYQKGEILLEINQNEYKMTLLAQKSEFITLLTSILPDLKADYPDSYAEWRSYASTINVKNDLPNLPDLKNEQELFYFSGKGIMKSYYAIRSGEERLKKYSIIAPYNGVVTLSKAEAGTAVRPGSPLGEYISNEGYELEVTVPLNLKEQFKPGNKANLTSADIKGSWIGKITRVGGSIDESTQSIKVYLEVAGSELKEGMYLTAELMQQPFENAMSIPRKLLDQENKVFIIKDEKLHLQQVTILSKQGDYAIISGLPAQTALLSTVIKSAHEGMDVKIDNRQ